MARLCERPGCSLIAEFRYAIDAEHLTVWLEPFESGGSDRAGVLCRRHADAMVVPLGWMLDDRRSEAPQLFRANAMPAVLPAVDRARRPRAGAPVEVEVLQLPLDATSGDAAGDDAVRGSSHGSVNPDSVDPDSDGTQLPVADESPVATPIGDPGAATLEVVEPDLTHVLPWRPVFDQSDDLDGLLTAQSPLLRRAFGKNPPPAV
jgi:hypothetical protein